MTECICRIQNTSSELDPVDIPKDKPETVKNRLDVYHKQTQPLIDYYTEKNILKTVDGTVDMMDVFGAITSILG